MLTTIVILAVCSLLLPGWTASHSASTGQEWRSAAGRAAGSRFGPNHLQPSSVIRQDDDSDKTVHLVFSNHLDVGYGGLPGRVLSYDNAVINAYFNEYYPRAIRLAQEMRAVHPNDRFIYLTHSWLLSLFFDCPCGMGLDCPTKDAVQAMEEAIGRGDITWHAFPFNAQAEMYEPELYDYMLGLTHELDDRFNLPYKAVMSQRDIPGLTRGAIPLLNRRGVLVLTVGVNGASAPPGVPKTTPFVWRDVDSGAELLAMWHPGGYGGVHHGVSVDGRDDCITAPGFAHVLCVAWRQDNVGPPESIYEIGQVYMHVKDAFPGANVRASSLEEYGAALLAAAPSLDLPLVTGEIGDTWVYGTGSDPLKVADYRALSRILAPCLATRAANGSKCHQQDPAIRNATRLLAKVGEHTWGLAIQVLGDWHSWSNEALATALKEERPGFMAIEQSWRRQAAYVDWAVQALEQCHPDLATRFRKDRAQRLVEGGPRPADIPDLQPLPVSPYLKTQDVLPEYTWRNPSRTSSSELPDQDIIVSSMALEFQGSIDMPQALPDHDTSSSSSAQRLQGSNDMPGQAVGNGRFVSLTTKYWTFALDLKTGTFTSLRIVWPAPQQPTATSSTGSTGATGTAGTTSAASSEGNTSSAGDVNGGHTGSTGSTGSAPGNSPRRLYASATRVATKAFSSSSSDGGRGVMRSSGTEHLPVFGPDRTADPDRTAALVQASSSDPDRIAGTDQTPLNGKSDLQADLDLDLQTGLGDIVLGANWAGPGSLLGLPQYTSYSAKDYTDMLKRYSYGWPPWEEDFGKPNATAGGARNTNLAGVPQAAYYTANATGLTLYLKFSWGSGSEATWSTQQAGAPAEMWAVYTFPNSSRSLHLDVIWVNKTRTRLPEALWVQFKPGPGAVDLSSWALHKMGSRVHPMEVIRNGSQSMHAVGWQGVSVAAYRSPAARGTPRETLHIHSLDANLVSPGSPSALPNPDVKPALKDHGVSYCLYNNVWGTNYVMWYPYKPEQANMKFRFVLDVVRD